MRIAGFGQILVDGEWLADVAYGISSKDPASPSQYSAQLLLQQGQLTHPFGAQDIQLVCPTGQCYKVVSAFTLVQDGQYEALVVPLPLA
jgi:hypothetical protein